MFGGAYFSRIFVVCYLKKPYILPMKLLKLLLLLLFVFPLFSLAQRNADAIIDTVETPKGTAILYKNLTWEYLQNEPVMMSQ